MASLKEIKLALKAVLDANIAGVNVYPKIVDNPAVPAIVIRTVADLDYLQTFGSSDKPVAMTQWDFDLLIATGADVEFRQDPLDDLIDVVGDRSIVAALLRNHTLGRDDLSLRGPIRLAHNGTVTFGQTEYIGAIIRLGTVTTHA